jgi:hypothetical protein
MRNLTRNTTPKKKAPGANPHNLITQEFKTWDDKVRAQNKGSGPTHRQIEQKKIQMDKKYGRFYDRHINE